jgi:hypothetical protein
MQVPEQVEDLDAFNVLLALGTTIQIRLTVALHAQQVPQVEAYRHAPHVVLENIVALVQLLA